jgi:hypothetical protein
MFADQAGVCVICKKVQTETMHVDHCHATGKIRALLCGRCNPALGLFDDDVERLAQAITYLKSF